MLLPALLPELPPLHPLETRLLAALLVAVLDAVVDPGGDAEPPIARIVPQHNKRKTSAREYSIRFFGR